MNIFTKEEFKPVISKHGFSDIDLVSMMKIQTSISTLVSNIASNSKIIAGNDKISKRHVKSAIDVMRNVINLHGHCSHSKQSGGNITGLPHAYFGAEDVANYDVAYGLGVDPRFPIDSTFPLIGGAQIQDFLTTKKLKEIVNKGDIKLSDPSLKIMGEYIKECIHALLVACAAEKRASDKSKAKVVLTEKLMFNTIKKNCVRFMHMSHLLKIN